MREPKQQKNCKENNDKRAKEKVQWKMVRNYTTRPSVADKYACSSDSIS